MGLRHLSALTLFTSSKTTSLMTFCFFSIVTCRDNIDVQILMLDNA